MRDATTPPPPSSRLRTPPTPKHGAGYHSYDPYEPRRSQRVQRLHNKTHDKVSLSPKSTLQRTSSSQTLSPPSSPAVDLSTNHQTPARPTPVRQSLFTRNRPTNTPNTNSLFDVFSAQPQLPTPASMLPTPNKTPRKRDTNAMQSTARILNFKPGTQSVMPTPRKKAKSRLTLDEDDAVHDEVKVFTDIQDRVPTVDNTEDNPFIGSRKTRGRTRAQTAPSSSMDADMEDAHAEEKGILYVFRGKKVFRRFEKTTDEPADSDASTGSNDSLKRKAGAAASRPLTRSSFKPRLLWPSANSDGDADEEALTDIDEDNIPSAESAPFGSLVPSTKTPSKKAGAAHPATPPSSHRHTRSAAQQIAIFADPHNELNRALVSPSATPMPQKVAPAPAPLFSDWSRGKNAEEKAARGEKRHRVTMSEPEVPAKRTRSNIFFSDRP